MGYVTNSEIEEWIGTVTLVELTDDEATGSVNAGRVDAARVGAEGEANSYLATRYRVPVDVSGEGEVAAALRAFVLDLVSYRLQNRRPPVSEDVIRRHTEALTWLSRVASGMVQLPSEMAVLSNSALGLTVETGGPGRAMTRDSLEDL